MDSDSDEDFFNLAKNPKRKSPEPSPPKKPPVEQVSDVEINDSDPEEEPEPSPPPKKRKGRPKKSSSPLRKSGASIAPPTVDLSSFAIEISSDDEETDNAPKRKKQKHVPEESEEDDLDKIWKPTDISALTSKKPAIQPARGSAATLSLDLTDSALEPKRDSLEFEEELLGSAGPSVPRRVRPTRSIDIKVFHTILDNNEQPRSMVFTVDSNKTPGDYADEIMAAFYLPPKQSVRFLYNRVPISSVAIDFDQIEAMVQKKKYGEETRQGPLRLEMMTLHDFTRFMEDKEQRRETMVNNKGKAPVQISDDEPEIEEDRGGEQEKDEHVRLIVRFQNPGAKELELKMKVPAHKTVGEITQIFTTQNSLSGKFKLKDGEDNTHPDAQSAGELLEQCLEDVDDDEERDDILKNGLRVDLYRQK